MSEAPSRINRRMIGLLSARRADLGLERVPDPRRGGGLRWNLETLLFATVSAHAAGCRSLAEAEKLTEHLTPAARRKLGILRRISDTTLRSALVAQKPQYLRRVLYRVNRAAYRRKALEPSRQEGLPFGVVAMDGKATALSCWDEEFSQCSRDDAGRPLHGLLRTITSALVSHPAKPCLDACPVPPCTNEMGIFERALGDLVAGYRGMRLFSMVTYDAGACSLHNGTIVREHGLHYLFGLKGTQPLLLAEAERHLSLLASQHVAAETTDKTSDGGLWHRRLHVTSALREFLDWTHLRTVLRVESERLDPKGRRVAYENRYFISSLPLSRLAPAQWLQVVRLHWGVENACHHTFDTVFAEDDHPWIEANPQGALAVLLLRRIAYCLLALFRAVTLRTQDRRQTPWRDILRWVELALIRAGPDDTCGLRLRPALH